MTTETRACERLIQPINTENPQIVVNKLLKIKEVFAEGLGFYKLLGIFVFGCIFGTYWEQLLELIVNRRWITQQGVIYGPFNPVYGIGAAGLIWLLCGKRRKWYLSFIYGAFALGAFEYQMHEMEFAVTGNVSWNYTYALFSVPSIATRGATSGTSIPHMIFWGGLGLFLTYIVYPALSKVIEAVPARLGKPLFNALVVFLILDIALTGAVLVRYGERAKGIEPQNVVEEWIDQNYPDEVVYTVFPDKFQTENR
jgi:uncharacterized membrane protein